MLTNTRTVRIEWGDCDPAGIVFYPRFFAMFDTSTTALFERALGMTKYRFIDATQGGVAADVDRRRPEKRHRRRRNQTPSRLSGCR